MACINNNYVNAMEDKKPNEIMGNNINNIGNNSKNNNHNKSEINNQKDNEFLPIETNNESDKEEIKELIKQPIENARIIKHLTKNKTKTFAFAAGYDIRYNHHYTKCAKILNLLKSFNDWNSNAIFTTNQLQTIYDIVKGAQYSLNNRKKIKRIDIEFAIDDKVLGIGLITEKIPGSCSSYHYNKCIFISPNRYGLFIVRDYDNYYKPYDDYGQNKEQVLANRSFRNFIDAVKLCSTKKLPIQFTNNDNKYQYFVTSNEYRNLLLVLLRDFWIAFHGEYRYDLLRLGIKYENDIVDIPEIVIKSNEEYKKLDKEYGDLKKQEEQYEEAFEDEYDEKNFIEIFGEETINNIRYIIHHLIDIEINTNYKLLTDKLDKIISQEKNLYETMRRSQTKGKALIDKCVQELKKEFDDLEKKVWTDNIVLPKDEDIFNKLGDESEIELSDDNFSMDEDYDYIISHKVKIDQYKLSSKQRVENYLKKLLYDKTLDDYLRNKVFKYIISSTDLIKDIHKNPSGTQEDRDLVKKKHIENINSAYILKNILEYVKDSNRLKKVLFFNKKEDKNDKNNNETDDSDDDESDDVD